MNMNIKWALILNNFIYLFVCYKEKISSLKITEFISEDMKF